MKLKKITCKASDMAEYIELFGTSTKCQLLDTL